VKSSTDVQTIHNQCQTPGCQHFAKELVVNENFYLFCYAVSHML